jgi:hypothetical protein
MQPLAATSTPTPSPSPEATATQQPSPTPEPSATPEPEFAIDLSGPDFEAVRDALGYLIAPTYLPDGFENVAVALPAGAAYMVMADEDSRLVVSYPVPFTLEESDLMKQMGLTRPREAIEEVEVDGEDAYLMHGGWSDATIMAGPSVSAETAEWEFDRSLAVFFDFPLGDGREIPVAVQALDAPESWTTTQELLEIAESIASVE